MRTFKLHPFPGNTEIEAKGKLYLEWMKLKNYADASVYNQSRSLSIFFQWTTDRGITRPQEITRQLLERYRKHVGFLKKKDGTLLNTKTHVQHIMTIRCFFRWLAKTNYILYNPAADLDLPRFCVPLPKHVLTISEAEQILSRPDITTRLGLRDRAILEIFYSTGIRRKELTFLKLQDTDLDRGTLMIREPKNRRDRAVPIGQRAQAWLEKYLRESRPHLVMEPDEGFVFVSREGGGLAMDYLSDLVSGYVVASGIGKPGACHLFRHSMATLMLEGGADIRYIQEMLGHVKLEATQIYAKVAISKLKEIHAKTHPGANLNSENDPD